MTIDASVRIRWISMSVVAFVVLLAVALLLPAIQQAREAARRTASRNNLRQIGLAFGCYHEQNGMLPSGGIFDDRGTPFNGWTSGLGHYLLQIAPISLPDPRYPWDDSVNIDRIIHANVWDLQNPMVAERNSADGLPLVHYAANQRLFYRNSVVRFSDIPELSSTALVGDSSGNHTPYGFPMNWRDISLGIGASLDGFGCQNRDFTMFLMADGSVKLLGNRIDAVIAQTLAGPAALEPTAEQVAKPAEPYRLKIRDYWRYLNVVKQGGTKGLVKFRLAPDQKSLHVDFDFGLDRRENVPSNWLGYYQKFVGKSAIEHVEIRGDLYVDELLPFLQIATLKRLTISGADIAGDKAELLAKLPKSVVVD